MISCAFKRSILCPNIDQCSFHKIRFKNGKVGKKPLEAEKSNTEWKIVSPGDQPIADKSKVARFLDQISGKRIKKFLTKKNTPKPIDSLEIEFDFDADLPSRRFEIWSKKDKVYGRELKSTTSEFWELDSILKGNLPVDRNFFYSPPKKAADKK